MNALGWLIVSTSTVACVFGGTSPSSMTLAGTWTGTIHYALNGSNGQQTFSMTLDQQDQRVNGRYTSDSAGYFTDGSVQGTVRGFFNGTFSFEPFSNPTGCEGTFDVSGGGGGTALTWTGTGFTSSCGALAPTGVTILVRR